MIKLNSRIFVAGHKGLVGSAIIRKLQKKGYKNIFTKTRGELDLQDQSKVFKFLKRIRPDYIFIAAAKVGGIFSNSSYKAEFINDNLSIQLNLIHGAYLSGVKNLIFLGSSCVYPRLCKQPIKEKYLLTGPLEKTNDAYAVAKIAGIKMCESYNLQYGTNYKCLMPTNTFGPHDDYDELNSHFIPALIRKIHKIKKKNLRELTLWGNGKARRETIFVDDIAEACIFFMKKKTRESLINIGTGKDFSIKEYARMILETIIPNRKIKIKFDTKKPNGTPRKVLNVSLAKKYGWRAKFKFKESIFLTYKSFLKENKL